MKTTLYQRSSTGSIKEWTIEQENNLLITSWGYLNGAIQKTVDIVQATNVGRSNEISAISQAKLEMERKVKKRLENGWVENISEVDKVSQSFSLKDLSTSFAPAKPVNTLSREEFLSWASQNLIIVQRKVDGQRHFLVKDEDGDVKIYSRKMKDMTEHVPHLAKLLASSLVPPGTVLDAELCLWDDNVDKFKQISAILRSLPERAKELQERDGPLSAYVFDILYWSGEATWKLPYEKRYRLMLEKLSGLVPDLILPINELLYCRAEDIADFQVVNKFEGYVIWRKDQASKLRWDGKPSRCNCFKLKKELTEDCIAVGWYPGKSGKNQGRFGGFILKQYHNGKLIDIGQCGGGFTDGQRTSFMSIEYPCVVEVKFAERLKSMKLRYPNFVRFREDKPAEECEVVYMPREL